MVHGKTAKRLLWLMLFVACVIFLSSYSAGSIPRLPSPFLDDDDDGDDRQISTTKIVLPAGLARLAGKGDWATRFAYVQYATGLDSLCNSLMIFDQLVSGGSIAGRLLLYSRELDERLDEGSPDGRDLRRLLQLAKTRYGAAVKPVDELKKSNSDPTWVSSYTKFHAWNQVEYERLILLDSDGTLLSPMDELFLLPKTPIAFPRAYWLTNRTTITKEEPSGPYAPTPKMGGPPPKKPAPKVTNSTAFVSVGTSAVVVLTPSAATFARLRDAIPRAQRGAYDMELVNALFGDSALVLPHRPYILLSGEFRRAAIAPPHDATTTTGNEVEIEAEKEETQSFQLYLGDRAERWDAQRVRAEAKYIHFSDWPVPKPWMRAATKRVQRHQPPCRLTPQGMDCAARDVWVRLYKDFEDRRMRVCKLEMREPHVLGKASPPSV